MAGNKGRAQAARRSLLAEVVGVSPRSLMALAIGTLITAAAPDARAEKAGAPATLALQIPAQQLSDALVLFSRSSGIQLFFNARLAHGLRSPGVAGEMSPKDALERLLDGTGLRYRFTNATTVVVFAPDNDKGLDANAQVLTLDTIEVTGEETSYVAATSGAGTKTNTPLIETSRSVDVITRREMDDRGVQSIPQAVSYSAGVVTGSYGFDPRFDQIYIRGFATTTLGDYRDGLRQVAGSYATFRTDPYGLDRIDVVKGPASVLYGQGTPGGIIDRLSKLPTEEARREVVGQVSTVDRFQGAFDVGGATTPNKEFLYRIVGLVRAGDTTFNIKDDRMMLAPAVTWRPTADTKMTVIALAQKDETDGNVAALNKNGQVLKIRASDPDYDYQKQEQYQIGYKFEHRFDDALTVRQNLRYSYLDLDGRYLTGSATGGGWSKTNPNIYNRGPAAVAETLNVFQVDNQALLSLHTGPVSHAVLAGIDYQWYDSNYGTGTGVANPLYALNAASPAYGVDGTTPQLTSRTGTRVNQTGVYVQDQIKFDNWRLSLGGRHDWVDRTATNLVTGALTGDKNDSAFTGSAGLLYLFDSGFAPYASYATSFQPTNYKNVDGNMLDPSRGEQYELGLKYQPPGSKTLLTLAAYRLTERDAPKYAGYNSKTGAYYYVAIGEIVSKGIEFEARTNIAPGFDAIASYTYNDAEITASNTPSEIGKAPAVTPKHSGSVWLDYTVQSGALSGWGGGVGVRYVGETFADNANTQTNAAYGLLDAGLRYDFGHWRTELKGWSLAVNATNLLDNEVSVCNTGYCYLSQGRTVVSTLRFRW